MVKEEKDTLIEDSKISPMVYLKGFFLISLVVFGMIFVNYMGKRSQARSITTPESRTLKVVSGLKASAEAYLQDNTIREEAYKTLEKSGEGVLGEATKAASIAAEKTTDTVTDFVYEHTIEVVIVNLIEKLPERQRGLFLERLCKDYACRSFQD